MVVTFWGSPRRRAPLPWVHQAGSVDEALAARDAGADAVIVQGVVGAAGTSAAPCPRWS